MPLDTSLPLKVLNQGDLQQLNDAHQSAALQQQSGKIAAQQAANTYATQVLSGAIASGDQSSYTTALQHLQGQGIDTSNFAPDIQRGSQQVQAARLAQSPLGSLLNLGLKAESNGIQAAGTFGKSGIDDPLSSAIMGQVLPKIGGGLPQQFSGVASNQPVQPPSPSMNVSMQMPSTPLAGTSNAGMDMSLPAQIPVSNLDQPSLVKPNTVAPFNKPQQEPNETLSAYKDRVEQAFQQYKADPNYQAASKIAETTAGKNGENIAEANKTLELTQDNLPIALKRFADIRAAAPDASYGFGVNSEGTGLKQELYKNFQDSTTGKANAMIEQRASQGILQELGPALAQSGVKGNKFLEQIANSASGLDPALAPDVKKQVVDGLEQQYIGTMKSSAKKLRDNGQQAPTDDQIDQMVAQEKAKLSPQGSGPKTGTIEDNHIFLGGDPASPSSWKQYK